MIHGINISGVEEYLSKEEKRRLKAGRWENIDVKMVRKYLSEKDALKLFKNIIVDRNIIYKEKLKKI